MEVAPGGFQDGNVDDELIVYKSVDHADAWRMSLVVGSGKSINLAFKGNLDVVLFNR